MICKQHRLQQPESVCIDWLGFVLRAVKVNVKARSNRMLLRLAEFYVEVYMVVINYFCISY